MRTGRIYDPEHKHPPEWQKDLNPDASAGMNYDGKGPERDHTLPTALDVKSAHRILAADFRDDELRQIPVLPAGARLAEGATYVDLRDFSRPEFTGRADMVVGNNQLIIPKAAVPYGHWNRLIGS
jgi:hypothetical protein